MNHLSVTDKKNKKQNQERDKYFFTIYASDAYGIDYPGISTINLRDGKAIKKKL